MKTAVVHDWLNGMRGGEKVLQAMLPLLPDPTIFTLFHVPGAVSSEIEKYPIRVSPLNRLPLARRHYRSYLPLFPRAVEAFDLSGFDLVVSSSHCAAKGVRAPAGAPHLCYCHTPARYAYEQFDAYFPEGRTPLRFLKRLAVRRFRAWDVATSSRPQRYLANSSAVAQRIRRHWNREASVLHPPVDLDSFAPSSEPRQDFLLAVGALVPYKRFEDAIGAAQILGRPLVLVGGGPEENRLRALAGSSVRIARDLPARELQRLYRMCAFFVQPGEEDFGIASVEAIASGAPVVALRRGGILDVVTDGQEGVLYDEQGPQALAAAVRRAETLSFDYNLLRSSASRFSPEIFQEGFQEAVTALLRSPDPISRSADSP